MNGARQMQHDGEADARADAAAEAEAGAVAGTAASSARDGSCWIISRTAIARCCDSDALPCVACASRVTGSPRM